MAQSKSFFGLRRGSTKSLTFSVFNGKQVTKDRVETVKNPRSELQMIQRMFFGTTCRAYSAMKQIVDHSFEGYSYGLKNMMHFTSINEKVLKTLQADPAKDPVFNSYQSDALAANPYIIAQGSAPQIQRTPGVTLGQGGINVMWVITELETLSANAFMQAVGFGIGELCTVCFLWQDYNSEAHFDFVRFTALKSGDEQLTAQNFDEYFLVESTLTGGQITIQNVAGAGDPAEWQIKWFSVNNDIEDGGYVFRGAIHSIKSDAGWLRSNVTLLGNTSFGGSLYEDALATYPIGQSYVLNGGDI